ncbi:MAG TPA: hypothetical protein VGE39_05690 [Prosthecobacter sp.]
MTTLRLISVVLPACLMLSACGGVGQRYDSRYPTVSQQDAFDVSWGLPARKSRGNPKMRYQYDSRAEAASAPVSAAPAPVEAAAPAPAPIAPIPPEQTRQAIPANLR